MISYNTAENMSIHRQLIAHGNAKDFDGLDLLDSVWRRRRHLNISPSSGVRKIIYIYNNLYIRDQC